MPSFFQCTRFGKKSSNPRPDPNVSAARPKRRAGSRATSDEVLVRVACGQASIVPTSCNVLAGILHPRVSRRPFQASKILPRAGSNRFAAAISMDGGDRLYCALGAGGGYARGLHRFLRNRVSQDPGRTGRAGSRGASPKHFFYRSWTNLFDRGGLTRRRRPRSIHGGVEPAASARRAIQLAARFVLRPMIATARVEMKR
jgi:hypothetical protein